MKPYGILKMQGREGRKKKKDELKGFGLKSECCDVGKAS